MKKPDENRSKLILIRLKPKELEFLQRRLKKSMLRNMSEYTREILLEKEVTYTYRNKSMDDVLEELIQIRRELNYIGHNFNQAVHKLNGAMGMPEAKLWQNMLIVLRDQLEPSIRGIKEKIDNYSEKWSQKL